MYGIVTNLCVCASGNNNTVAGKSVKLFIDIKINHSARLIKTCTIGIVLCIIMSD